MIDCHTRELLGWHVAQRQGLHGRQSPRARTDRQVRYAGAGARAFPASIGRRIGFLQPQLHGTRARLRPTARVHHPALPQQNGMVERVNSALKEQCVHRRRFETLQHASHAIREWIRSYNYRRPHHALKMQTPAEAYALAA